MGLNGRDTLLLFSGGHDSANLMDSIKPARAMFVNYGQSAWVEELSAASKIARRYGVNLCVKTITPLDRHGDEYIGRNMVLISLAVAEAKAMSLSRVVIGCTPEDFGLFPDCRDSFIEHISKASEEAYGITVEAPLEARPSYIIEGTWSCYEGGHYTPCGECYSCNKGRNQ